MQMQMQMRNAECRMHMCKVVSSALLVNPWLSASLLARPLPLSRLPALPADHPPAVAPAALATGPAPCSVSSTFAWTGSSLVASVIGADACGAALPSASIGSVASLSTAVSLPIGERTAPRVNDNSRIGLTRGTKVTEQNKCLALVCRPDPETARPSLERLRRPKQPYYPDYRPSWQTSDRPGRPAARSHHAQG